MRAKLRGRERSASPTLGLRVARTPAARGGSASNSCHYTRGLVEVLVTFLGHGIAGVWYIAWVGRVREGRLLRFHRCARGLDEVFDVFFAALNPCYLQYTRPLCCECLQYSK